MSTAVVRPCLSCSRDNPSAATYCTGCGQELTAWARPMGAAAVARQGLSPQLRQRVTLLLGLVLVAALAMAVIRFGFSAPRAATGPTWSRPHAMESWAKGRMRHAGVTPTSLKAVMEQGAGDTRRILVAEHSARQPLRAIVRAASELLLEARKKGERTSTHLYVIQQPGEDGAPPTRLAIPVGDAALLAKDDAEVARLIGGTSEDEAGPAPGSETEAPAAPVPSPQGASSFPVGPDFVGPPLPPPKTVPGSAEPVALAAAPPPVAPAAEPAPVTPPAAAAATPMTPATGKPAKPPNSVRLQRGSGAPQPKKLTPGDRDVVLLRLQVHPGARRALLLRDITAKASGTLNDTESVDFVNLVLDVDKDGKRGNADRFLDGPEAFGDDDGSVIFSGLELPFGADGAPLAFLIVADLSDETEGGTLQLTVPATEGVVAQEISSQQKCPVAGAPLSGQQFQVEGNIEPDHEQERLDKLAEEGPDAKDENLKR